MFDVACRPAQVPTPAPTPADAPADCVPAWKRELAELCLRLVGPELGLEAGSVRVRWAEPSPDITWTGCVFGREPGEMWLRTDTGLLDLMETVAHEAKHVEQFRRFGNFAWLAGCSDEERQRQLEAMQSWQESDAREFGLAFRAQLER